MDAVSNSTLSSQYVSVLGQRIHYLEAGNRSDPVMLFVHGMPTSSYLWRNIMPSMAEGSHCIAIDLIGMGKSDKPDIDYTFMDHSRFFDAFIEALGLQNITLVVHGWGSVIGLHYAARHEQNIAGVACYESHLRPVREWRGLSLPVQQLSSLLHDKAAAYEAVVNDNYFIKRVLPEGVVNPLSAEVLSTYATPFQTPESRELLWQYLQELPLGQQDSEVINVIASYSDWLTRREQPVLLMYAMPGFITTMETVSWAKGNIPRVELNCLEGVLHFAQESNPAAMVEALSTWRQGL